MTGVLLILVVPVVMWIGQTILLKQAGLPIRWRIDARGAPRRVRTFGRITTQAGLVGVILGYPLILRESPVDYYGRLLPAAAAPQLLLSGLAASVLILSVLFGVWLGTGRLRVEVHQARKRWVRRLVLLLPTTLLGATVEELLFRGVVLAGLLQDMPTARTPAVALAVFIFAGAHYLRGVKRYWTIGGHLVLGLLLCVAFLRTGGLWLPIGLHAGGILLIMGTRPFFRFRGPAWLTGASVFPYAGVVGMAGLGVLTAFVVSHYGAR